MSLRILKGGRRGGRSPGGRGIASYIGSQPQLSNQPERGTVGHISG